MKIIPFPVAICFCNLNEALNFTHSTYTHQSVCNDENRKSKYHLIEQSIWKS